MFVLITFLKTKETKLKFSHGVKRRNAKLHKLKSAAKNKTGKTLRIVKKNLQDEELFYELFLTTSQTTKIKNAFANNMSTDIET